MWFVIQIADGEREREREREEKRERDRKKRSIREDCHGVNYMRAEL